MPVSPADFYAYSQATGVQVPDSPEERAQLAPQVLQFRRNQLKQPQEQGFDPVSMGVGIGLALAGAGAGAMALRGRNKIPKSTKTTGQSGVKVEDLNKEVVSRASNVGKSKEPTGQDVYQETVSKPIIQTDRADELIREYRQGIVDREIRREDRVRNKLDALYAKEGNKVIDQLRAEADEEGMAARRQRIARNQQKEFDEARSYMSDVMESVIDEDIYETLPSSVINLAAKVQDPSLPLTTETVNNFNAWAQKTFANDPEVLSEINYNLERIPANLLKQTPDTASQANEAAQAMAQNTLSNIQKQQAASVSDQQINAAGSGEDQMTGRVRQQLQRDKDINLMEVDALEDVNTENINTMMEEADPSSRIGYEADTPMNQAAAQTAGMVPVDQIEGVLIPMSAQEFNEKYRKQFESQFPEELNPEIKSIPNVRARRYESENPLVEGESIESVLTGELPVIEETMQGREMRGGKINAAGDITYSGSSSEYESADTGVKSSQRSGEQYKAFAELSGTMKRMSDQELYALLPTPGTQTQQVVSKEQAQRNRLAREILRKRAVDSLEQGYQLSPEQLDILEKSQRSVTASENVRKQYQNQRSVASTGPEVDVSRAMSALRTGMEVDPSESSAYPKSYYQAWGEEKGEVVAGVSAPTVYTGAAAEAAGPVLFTGKSKANTVLKTNPITGTVETPAGEYRTQVNPDLLGTIYNVAGTPENQAISRQVEANAQQFLSNAIKGGLTFKQAGPSQQAVMPPPSGIRPKFIGPVPAKAAPRKLTQSFMPSGVEASQRTGYARYQPGISAQAPVSPFIGEMAGGTVQPTTNLTNLQRYPDIGRTTPNLSATQTRFNRSFDPEAPVRTISLNPDTGLLQVQTTYDISPRAREELAARNRPPIGPLTQSPGLPRVGNIVEKEIMDPSGSKVIGRQSTSEGFPITYPRMASGKAVPFYPGKRELEKGNLRKAQMVKNIPTRQTWKLSPDYPLNLTDPQTGETQTLYMGGGPLKRYTI